MSNYSQRVSSLLLYLYLFFHIAGVLGRSKGGDGEGGGGKSDGEGEGGTISDGADAGSDIGDAASSGLDLPPVLDAAFAFCIIFAVITALQLIRGLARFKHFRSQDGRLALARNVGVLFSMLLVFYTMTYTTSNVLRAVYIGQFKNVFFTVFTLGVVMEFFSQLSVILLYGTFLTIIAYRQRYQLNRQENVLNLKTFLEGLILTVMLFLGVAEDIVAGTNPFGNFFTIENIDLAFAVLGLLASIDVAISASIARARFSNGNKQDKVINITSSVVGPILLVGGIHGVIKTGFMFRNLGPAIDYAALLLATVVIEGVISVVAVACALSMSAPAANTEAKHDDTIEEKA